MVGDSIGDHAHHGGAEKAVYAVAREELDYWEGTLNRVLRDGYFGENLTTEGISWPNMLINQRIQVGECVLEVSIPRTPCATFSGWMDEPGWLKSFTERGDCGSYLRIIEPGRIKPGDEITLIGRPDHDITMGMAFAAKMGDKELARRVVDAGCLAPVHHEQLVKRLQPRD